MNFQGQRLCHSLVSQVPKNGTVYDVNSNYMVILHGLVIPGPSAYLLTRGWQEMCLCAGTVSVRARDGGRERREVRTQVKDWSRREQKYGVKSPYPAGMLSNPGSLPYRLLIFLPGQKASPVKPHSPGISASGLGEEHWKQRPQSEKVLPR